MLLPSGVSSLFFLSVMGFLISSSRTLTMVLILDGILEIGPHVRSNYLLINLFIVTGSRIRIRISKKVESEFKIALNELELIEISHESIFSSLSENSFFSFMRAQHIDNSCCWSAIYEKKLCQISHVLS